MVDEAAAPAPAGEAGGDAWALHALRGAVQTVEFSCLSLEHSVSPEFANLAGGPHADELFALLRRLREAATHADDFVRHGADVARGAGASVPDFLSAAAPGRRHATASDRDLGYWAYYASHGRKHRIFERWAHAYYWSITSILGNYSRTTRSASRPGETMEVVDGETGFGDDVESLLVQDDTVGVATRGDYGAILARFEAPVRVSRVTVAPLHAGGNAWMKTLARTLLFAKLEVLLDDGETWEEVATVEKDDDGTIIGTLEIDASGSVWRLTGLHSQGLATSRFFFETNNKKGYKPAQILQGQPVDGKAWTLSVSNVYGSGSYGITSDDASKLLYTLPWPARSWRSCSTTTRRGRPSWSCPITKL